MVQPASSMTCASAGASNCARGAIAAMRLARTSRLNFSRTPSPALQMRAGWRTMPPIDLRSDPVARAVVLYPALVLQLDQMRQHRTRGGRMQLFVHVRIHPRHHRGDRVEAVPDAGQHLALAVVAM